MSASKMRGLKIARLDGEVRPLLRPRATARAARRWALWRRRLRSWLCVLTHGQHELYVAYSDTKVFQQCLLCGHETTGWTIDRRDRRLHVMNRSSGRK